MGYLLAVNHYPEFEAFASCCDFHLHVPSVKDTVSIFFQWVAITGNKKEKKIKKKKKKKVDLISALSFSGFISHPFFFVYLFLRQQGGWPLLSLDLLPETMPTHQNLQFHFMIQIVL